MSDLTVTVNDNLVKFDNLLTGLEYLMEEVATRKESILSEVDLNSKIEQKINTNEFKNRMIRYVQNYYGESLYREIAFMVMEKIDSDIEAFINHRVDERIQELQSQNGVTIRVWFFTFFTFFIKIFSHLYLIMEVQTLSFDYGNLTTVLGFIGVVSTLFILITVFRAYSSSPLRKW